MYDKFEKRTFTEYRALQDDNGNSIITGVPIVFEQYTDIGGWYREIISRGAINESILTNIDFYYNHNLNSIPHARSRNGKLSLSIDNDHVSMKAEINRKRADSNDLYLAVQDNIIDGMSFMFRVAKDEWTDLDTAYPTRRILEIAEIIEVSAVNYPAYDGTSISARSDIQENEKHILKEARERLNKSNFANELELLKIKSKI